MAYVQLAAVAVSRSPPAYGSVLRSAGCVAGTAAAPQRTALGLRPAAGIRRLERPQARSFFAGCRVPGALKLLPAARPRGVHAQAARASAAVEQAEAPAPVGGPAWDISTEYPSIDSAELEADIAGAVACMERIEKEINPRLVAALEKAGEADASTPGAPPPCRTCARRVSGLRWEATRLLGNVSVYATCEASTDARNAAARALSARVRVLFARFTQALQPAQLFLLRASDAFAAAYLDHEDTAAEGYEVRHRRRLRDRVLSLPEENLAASLAVNGITAWGSLYDQISGSLAVELEKQGKTVGVAAAAGMLDSTDRGVRQEAWEGIRRAWKTQEEACAAMINAIAGWRLDLYKRRGHTDFLEVPLHDNRMSRATLDAMFAAVDEARDVGRKALLVQAHALGLTRLAPGGLRGGGGGAGAAGAERGGPKYTFDEAVSVVEGSVGAVDPAAGEFVRMMAQRRWIEARAGNAKRPGAYCTQFRKSRTPRVYLSAFSGGDQHLLTLAHELGHGFHNWAMRDMPLSSVSYPLNLAETASIFFETVVADGLAAAAQSPYERFRYGWADAESAGAFLLNIPARFEFERAVYGRRAEGSLTPDDLSALMDQAWGKYYGGALSQMDDSFWMSKLHFYISSVSFYNFPYTFGYLFALGVYAQRERLGAAFPARYAALLRDTGSMDTEELVRRHLEADVSSVDFWRASTAAVRAKVDAFAESYRALLPDEAARAAFDAHLAAAL
eukprot:tig00000367_g24467.t1